MATYSIIDQNTWKRKGTFDKFVSFERPMVNITVRVAVKELYQWSKDSGHSFFLAYLHCAAKAVNAIPELRTRLVGQEVRLYDVIHPGCTVLHPDETFGYNYYDYYEERAVFCEAGSLSLKNYLDKGGSSNPMFERYDLIHGSTLPWINFSQMEHPKRGADSDFIPKISFGKAIRKNNESSMPVSIQVHHGLADGLHIARFFEHFEEYAQT